MDNKSTHITIAGAGGQGVVVVGNLIARACVIEGTNVSGWVAYGAEMRGGTANATVVVSEEEIACPFVETPDMAIILNQPSLERFEVDIAAGGLVLLNTSMIPAACSAGRPGAGVSAGDRIAQGRGKSEGRQIVALGAFIDHTQVLKMDSIQQAIRDLFASKNPQDDRVEPQSAGGRRDTLYTRVQAGLRAAQSLSSSGCVNHVTGDRTTGLVGE
jgi:2-oxoglutarate ferredoxin oxidoreductase subunit gamma